MSNKNNYFSIVIPLYNKENSISATVNSVLNQTYGDFELIIVNDGSTDNSLKVVQSIQDERIRIINKENGGVSSARNIGIKQAKNDWISFLDGDDLWRPDYLKMVLEMIHKYPKSDVVAIGWKWDNDKEQNRYDEEGYIENYFKLSLKYSGIICSSAVTIKKECFNLIGLFREDLNRGEDLEMWTRLAKRFMITYLPSVLVIYSQEVENRVSSIPITDLKKTYTYNINLATAKNVFERKYYLNRIGIVLLTCLSQKNYKGLNDLLNKHGILIILRSLFIVIKNKMVKFT